MLLVLYRCLETLFCLHWTFKMYIVTAHNCLHGSKAPTEITLVLKALWVRQVVLC